MSSTGPYSDPLTGPGKLNPGPRASHFSVRIGNTRRVGVGIEAFSVSRHCGQWSKAPPPIYLNSVSLTVSIWIHIRATERY
eukprot:2271078-Rhodomonas_salina.1